MCQKRDSRPDLMWVKTRSLLLLVSVLSQALLALVSRHLMSFSLLTVRHDRNRHLRIVLHNSLDLFPRQRVDFHWGVGYSHKVQGRFRLVAEGTDFILI